MAATTPTTDDLVTMLFAQFDRSHEGATRLRFLNNGGRSRLMLTNHDGTAKRLAPTIHKDIHQDVLAVAHAWARAAYGPRPTWPVHLTAERPTP